MKVKKLVFATTLAALTCLSLTTAAKADSEAGFIMLGSGSESGGPSDTGASSETGGPLWGESSTESGGAMDSGAESDSGGATQSEAESLSGGAYDSGASSEAVVGGTERNWNRYVQYYGGGNR